MALCEFGVTGTVMALQFFNQSLIHIYSVKQRGAGKAMPVQMGPGVACAADHVQPAAAAASFLLRFTEANSAATTAQHGDCSTKCCSRAPTAAPQL